MNASAGDFLIESLDLDALGVGHQEDGKVVLVEGALPFEWVRVQVNRKKEHWECATVIDILQESAQRVQARCPHFGLHRGACGGCKMQHLEPAAQVAVKNRALEDALWDLGRVWAQTWLPAIHGPTWGYRFRARLAVRYVRKKGTVLVGFHERKSRYIADIQSCAVLLPAVSALLLPLRGLITSLEACETCPQIELAAGDNTIALVLRHLQPLCSADLEKLRTFANQHADVGLQWWLQPNGLDSVQRLDAGDGTPELGYALPEFGVCLWFHPTDFTQVNPAINQVLVARALRLLAVQKSEYIIDWFCGLGNFTLPLATQAVGVLGVEGSETMVARAQANLRRNSKASAKTDFVCRDLFAINSKQLREDVADKWLIDPPREGAQALCQALADLQQNPGLRASGGVTKPWFAPKRILYVSCNPATLARDADLLVHQAGYRLQAAGVVNMFAHTAHVESMALFVLED